MKYNIFKISINKEKGIKPVSTDKFMLSFSSKNYKIYVLKHNEDFIYVGQTKQTIGARFGQSFKAYKRHKANLENKDGYNGYKWIEKYKELSLYVFDLELKEKEDKIKAEAIEAELVYLVRNKTKKWPISQNEIHFNNEYNNAKKIAEEIYKVIEG